MVEPLAQQVLLHLAHGVARELVDEDDALGQLELRQTAVKCRQDGTNARVASLKSSLAAAASIMVCISE